MEGGDTFEELAVALEKSLGADSVQRMQPLARHTALHIGGPVDLLVRADSGQALQTAITTAWSQGAPCRVLGSGSNVLVSDRGVRGVVVLNRARAVSFAPDSVKAESGVSLSTLARQCIARGQAGLEWAIGIPGTVGGAVVGNAGAWGSDIASTLSRASLLEPPDSITAWPVECFGYGYRTSVLKRGGTTQQGVVLEAEFKVEKAERTVLEVRAAEITAKRRASQPPGASCGSVFKNPTGDFAGRLIEAAGLKGKQYGGAKISRVHANFIVNTGQARASDVKALIDLASDTVQSQFGVALELEIELIGEW